MKLKLVLLCLSSFFAFAMSHAQVIDLPQGNSGCAGDSLLLLAMTEANAWEWNVGGMNDSLWVNTTGYYLFTELDSGTSSDSVLVTFTPLPDPLTNEEHVTCFGLNDGGVEIFSVSGIPIESVIWNEKLTGSSIYNLFAGEYNYVFTDVNGCVATGQVVIEQPDLLQITGVNLTGNQLEITVEGGTPPYVYFWNEMEVPNPEEYTGLDLNISVIDLEGCEALSTYTGIKLLQDQACSPYFSQGILYNPCFRDGWGLSARIFDSSGKLVHSESLITETLDLKHLNPGLLHLTFFDGVDVFSLLVFKEG